jgi:hypothetical protein
MSIMGNYQSASKTIGCRIKAKGIVHCGFNRLLDGLGMPDAGLNGTGSATFQEKCQWGRVHLTVTTYTCILCTKVISYCLQNVHKVIL